MPKKKKEEEKIKNSYLQSKKSDTETVDVPDFGDEEKKYLSNLQRRLEKGKREHELPRVEFDNLSFTQYWSVNEKKANTELEPIKNKIDTAFQSGTLRRKMFSYLATDVGLDFRANITAYNESNVIVNSLGNAMEDIIEKTEEMENDKEWQMLRQYEKMKHGYVFIEDLWEDRWSVKKDVSKGMMGKKTGVKITSTTQKHLGYPKRTILSGLSVFLGDWTKYMIEDQPYIFTVNVESYEELEAKYKDWEMWKHVGKTVKSFTGDGKSTISGNSWSLYGSDNKSGEVEVIRYQDKIHNEFQLILNGVPMLPMGYPLTKISPDGEYTIIQQNLEPIRADFAIGKSFIYKNKNLVAILDEMMKMAVLKTQQSYAPAMLNLSDRVVSRSIFMPATITRGIKPGDIAPVMADMGQGVTNSELAMIQEVKGNIDENTTSQTFGGQKERGQVTATQIIEIQRQASIMMGLLTLSSELLEKKLTSKRLVLLLHKWFDPIDKELDEARQILKNKYRRTSLAKNIEGEGMGVRMVIPTEQIPESSQVAGMEDKFTQQTGMPIRMILLNPKEMQKVKLTWVITINPKPKRSTELSKLLFAAEMRDAMALGLRVNPDYMEQRFAEIWDEDPSKMFLKPEEMNQMTGGQPPQGAPPSGTPTASPQIKMPPSGMTGGIA